MTPSLVEILTKYHVVIWPCSLTPVSAKWHLLNVKKICKSSLPWSLLESAMVCWYAWAALVCWSASLPNVSTVRSSIFRKNDLFDPCDPYMTFEVKLLITFVATHPLVILTKFGRNPIKHVEEEANCEKKKRKEERKLRNTPNLTRSCALYKGTR